MNWAGLPTTGLKIYRYRGRSTRYCHRTIEELIKQALKESERTEKALLTYGELLREKGLLAA